MAKVYVAGFAGVYTQPSGVTSQPRTPPVAEQTVAIGGASAQSAAFNAATQVVRVHADAICSIAFGANPTATASTMRMAAGQTEYFAVNPGDKIAVITNS